MKHIYRILIVVLVTTVSVLKVSAKDQDPGTMLVCDTVLQAPDLTASQIYDNVKVWFANNMRSANQVIQLDDVANKHIIGKSNFDFTVNNLTWYALSGQIRFTIDVAARDGRFRVRISDFIHEAVRDGWSEGLVYVGGPNPNIKGLRKKQNSEMQKRALPLCIDNIALILVSLQEAVSGSNPSVVDEEW